LILDGDGVVFGRWAGGVDGELGFV